MLREIEVVVRGQSVRLSREQIADALRNIEPGRIKKHAVEIDGKDFPVKQVFAIATGRDVLDFDTTQARSALQRLGLVVKRVG